MTRAQRLGATADEGTGVARAEPCVRSPGSGRRRTSNAGSTSATVYVFLLADCCWVEAVRSSEYGRAERHSRAREAIIQPYKHAIPGNNRRPSSYSE